jgi:hypothetical protein
MLRGEVGGEGVSSPCGHNVLERTKMLPEARSRAVIEIQTEIKKVVNFVPFLRFSAARQRGKSKSTRKTVRIL